ncbi:glycosyltransferase family 2 protein [Pediococcus pentosaceus]|uniref:glycosyltransferase family 2 protein n=1 Tax=Pediococcus pentosaceus TaxID=1255 RepID=UPI000E012CDB|nr:glycosyltransferase family 2 protein [Pediococcus pentosaceus]KAF0519025.1 glycosyltransferase [Pediococcus pentosaceus]MBF7111826.1 glycosyltransferase family 2 protein [Pediococcus pentosaceus]MBF7116728.1 glycosyltransferase family 2 protein [Pediococcus pentosaceus]MBF7118468.1 glycosyltransferase family 2 protein [Pediococcus pentosaceus]MCS8577506.1 glycosyltransferase family 2 protein [Pediococcus pentosaceus]
MNKLVSIVIPIYNVEDFLENCLNSVKNQSYKDIEVLLVDDGSKDNSKKICDEFVEIDDRFKYVYQKNSGVSSARNNGMRNARGEYITFVDGDDYLDKDHIEKMVNGLSQSELVISGRKNVTESGINSVFQNDKDILFNKKELIDQILRKGIVFSYPWNKMFKMEILLKNSIEFDEKLDYGEDLVFDIQYATLIRKSMLITGSTYNYVYREDSVSRQWNATTLKKRITDLLSIKRVIEILTDDFVEEKAFLNKRIVVEGAGYIRLMYVYNFSVSDINTYKKIVINAYEVIKKSLNGREKLIYFVSLKFPKLMYYISKLKRNFKFSNHLRDSIK